MPGTVNDISERWTQKEDPIRLLRGEKNVISKGRVIRMALDTSPVTQEEKQILEEYIKI